MSVARRSIELGDDLADFIDQQIASGRFTDANAVVRAGLRLLEGEEARLEELRAMIAVGDADFAAGRYRVYESASELAESIMKRVMAKSERGAS